MVTFTKPEAVTTEESVAPPSEQEELNTSGGDADPTVSTDAAEVKPDASSEADLKAEAEAAYKADLEGKEGEQKAPEPERRPAVDPALVAQARNTLSNNHRARQEKIDAYDSELEDIGVEKALRTRLVKELKDFLTEEHADGLRLAGYEAAETTKVREQGAVYNSLLAHVPKAQETAFLAELDAIAKANNGFMPYKDVFAAYNAKIRDEGTEKGDKAGFLRGFIAGRAQAENNKSSAQSGQNVNGIAGGGTSWRTKAEAATLHVQGKITNAQMRQINADPSIPEGY